MVPLYIILSTVMFAWNVLIAGRVAQLRRAPRNFATLTALCGLLLAPALLIAFAASSILYGRAMQPLLWVWPVIAIMFLLQVLYALSKRLVTPLFGVPLMLYNTVIAAVAISSFVVSRGSEPPEFVHGLAAAQASAAGIVFGAAALWKTAYVQIPLLAPALPAHWRASAFARGMLALIAMAMTAVVLVEVPDGLGAVRSYPRYEDQRLQERPAGDFALGLKIFPDLSGAVSRLALRNDTALAHQLEVDVVSVVLTPEAVQGAALDSLARALMGFREDSVLLVVALGYSPKTRGQLGESAASFNQRRLRQLDQIIRRLRPDVLLPAVEPYGEGSRAIGMQPVQFWVDYLTAAADLGQRLRPAMKVGVGMSSYGARDSVLYSWAARPGSPMDVVGFSLLPGFDGATTLDTRMRIAQRWLLQNPERQKPHWVFNAGGFPAVHGERSQQLAIWGALAWATTQSPIKGLIVGEAGDYNSERGLRAPNGRLRPAVAMIMRARGGLREAAAP
ncbi:hypothetical protein BH23GEM1_BH23GEM1_02030 [soil metagenome]